MPHKKRVLFVGSFISSSDGASIGGQNFACRTLVDSELSESIEWLLVDSTGTMPMKPVWIRAALALKRIIISAWYLLTRKVDTVLIFTAHGVSFFEKGIICILASYLAPNTILAPRSGLILNDLKIPIRRRYIRWVFSRASRVVCQSPYWQSTFKALAPDANCTVIHNWIDTDKYHQQTPPHRDEQSPFQLLFIGWVVHDKGIMDLYQAVHAISHEHNIQLSICGAGDAMEELQRCIDNDNLADVVQLKGWVQSKSKMQALKEASAFVLPTHFEGFPNALLEAMASGVPCVCSDIPPISSLVRDRHHCLLFETKNTESLAEALLEMITSTPEARQLLATHSRELVSTQFSVEYGVRAFKEIL